MPDIKENKESTKDIKEKVKTPADGVKAAKEKNEALIYIGPTVFRVVSSGTVFINGLTPQIEAAVGNMPAIRELFVPVKEAAKARKEAETEGTAMRRFYKEAENYRR